MEAIYERPLDYDLEHEGDDEDVAFYVRLVKQLRPSRILELASGSGRVTIPLARTAAVVPCEIVGLELADSMLDEASRKRDTLDDEARRRVTFVRGDMREWRSDVPFDLIITPCSSLSHLLSVEDQLRTWRAAWENLSPGGRFVADLTMPNLGAYAESMQVPPRTLLEIDVDTRDPVSGTRLLRYKTTRYVPYEQRAETVSSTTSFQGALTSIATSATSSATSTFHGSWSCCSDSPGSRSSERMGVTTCERRPPRAASSSSSDGRRTRSN